MAAVFTTNAPLVEVAHQSVPGKEVNLAHWALGLAAQQPFERKPDTMG